MINALFAVDQYGGMGFNGSLPWPHNAEDLARFKQLTTGHVVVMGRKTYDDPKMPKPLKDRTVYVVSNRLLADSAYQISGDINEELLKIENRHPDKIIWVIGGVNLLEQCTVNFDQIYLTHFKGSYKVDTRIQLKSVLAGYTPKEASASPNSLCTHVIYENIFKRPKPSFN
jgi:dihydrofolate reductase